MGIPLFTARKFNIICYLGKEELISLLDSIPNFEQYSFIEHNKDINEDGTQKEKHIHLLLKTSVPYKSLTVYNKFRIDERNVRIIQIQDEISDTEYLVHKNHRDKYQYDEAEVISKGEYFARYLGENADLVDYDTVTRCVIDVVGGKDHIDLLREYGSVFVKNHKNIMDVAKLVSDQLAIDSIIRSG